MYQFSVKKSVYASWVSHLLNDRITKVKNRLTRRTYGTQGIRCAMCTCTEEQFVKNRFAGVFRVFRHSINKALIMHAQQLNRSLN